ncbi:hypothetical protein [Vibrio agarivorans]|uniref:Uncharacterized protein n=1 Tax=Vibrio agarivorans TaxID=153622 RepID=A0ABT7Y6Y8_9VIBR|nr:hypothetical protein [Vibrio agarivorans]MDN2483817.1 hypothetical protein [Vibrio agarivorans]
MKLNIPAFLKAIFPSLISFTFAITGLGIGYLTTGGEQLLVGVIPIVLGVVTGIVALFTRLLAGLASNETKKSQIACITDLLMNILTLQFTVCMGHLLFVGVTGYNLYHTLSSFVYMLYLGIHTFVTYVLNHDD